MDWTAICSGRPYETGTRATWLVSRRSVPTHGSSWPSIGRGAQQLSFEPCSCATLNPGTSDQESVRGLAFSEHRPRRVSAADATQFAVLEMSSSVEGCASPTLIFVAGTWVFSCSPRRWVDALKEFGHRQRVRLEAGACVRSGIVDGWSYHLTASLLLVGS